MYKKVREHICLFPPRVKPGGLKDWYGWNLYCTETANYIHFRAERCQKYASHQKKLFRIEFPSAYVYTPAVDLGARKIEMVEILYCTEMANYIQFRGKCQRIPNLISSFTTL